MSKNVKDYVVKPGDTLASIAQRNNMTLKQLLALQSNEQFKANPNTINPSQYVKISTTSSVQEHANDKTYLAGDIDFFDDSALTTV